MMKRLIMDLDDTICTTVGGDYSNSIPDKAVINKDSDTIALIDYERSLQ